MISAVGGSSLVSSGRRAAGTYEARPGRGLISLSWINLPWRSQSDIETRKFQSKSICTVQSAEDLQKLHSMTALVSESGAGWRPAEATQSSRSPGQAHRTLVSNSGNSPQLTTTWETSYTSPPRDRICRKDYRLPSRSSTVQCLQYHITVETLCAPTLLPTETQKHCLAWQLWLLSSTAGGENQPLGNVWPSHKVLFLDATTILREAKAITVFAICIESLVCSGPYYSSTGAPGPAGPGEVTLLRPLFTGALMQSLLCTA